MKLEKNKLSIFFITICLLIISIVTESQALTNKGVQIPFIKFSATIPLIVFCVFNLILLMVKKKFAIKFDIISILLFTRIFLSILPPLYIDDVPQSYLGNLANACLPFFIYTIMNNLNFNHKQILKVFIFFGLFVSFQVFLTYYVITKKGIDYFDLFYKAYVVLPIGASNYISCVLLSFLIIGDKTIDNKYFRFFFDFAIILAIIITKSRTGVILLVLYFIILLYKMILSNENKYKYFLIILLPIFIIFIDYFTIRAIYQILIKFFSGFADLSSLDLNSILSGRLSIYKDVLIETKKHLILGNGLCYEILNLMRPHNFILTILYENGIAGLLLYIVITFILIRNIKTIKKSKVKNVLVYLIIFLTINSLVEDCFFSVPIDIIFWTVIAICTKYKKLQHNNIEMEGMI